MMIRDQTSTQMHSSNSPFVRVGATIVSCVAALAVGCGGSVASPNTQPVDAAVVADSGASDAILSFDAGATTCGTVEPLTVSSPSVPEIVVDLDAPPAAVDFSITTTTATSVDVSSSATITPSWSSYAVGDRSTAGGPTNPSLLNVGPVGGSFSGTRFTPSLTAPGHVAYASLQLEAGACTGGFGFADVVRLRTTPGTEDVLLHGFGSACHSDLSAGPTNIGRFRHRAATTSASTKIGTTLGSDMTLPFALPASLLIAHVRAVVEGDASLGCVTSPGVDTDGDGVLDTFTSVASGATVCFEAVPRQAPSGLYCHPGGPHHFEAFVDVVEGSTPAGDRRALVVAEPSGSCTIIC